MAVNLVLTLTSNGKDAFWNSKNTGVMLDITHLQFGTRNRLTTGEEVSLNQPKQHTKIQNGNKIAPDQVRIMATMPGTENYNVTEIGLWSGTPGESGSILVAYKSVQTGFVAQMVSGIDLVFTYDMVLSTADIDHVNIIKDTDQGSTFSLLAEHVADRNSHPFYVTLDTLQNITGAKTFTNQAVFSGGLSGELTGNAATATKLATARTIGGVSFDGSAAINLPGVNTAGNQNTTGNAATATKLATARTIGGVSFDGTANINLPGVNTAGNQNTTGSAAKLTTARTIGGVSFDGTANINLPGVNTTGNQSTTGNAATATKLATARTINGVSFNGSANITISNGISILTGSISDGGTIPLPSGYTEAQCKWMISMGNAATNAHGANNAGQDFYQQECYTTGRVVTAHVKMWNNTLTVPAWASANVNYIIIGSK